MTSKPLLIVFAKRPEPGKVKTRLCPPFRPEQAAAFYACVLEDVLEATAAFGAELGCALRLAIHPDEAVDAPGVEVPTSFERVSQRGEGLAERMENALMDAAAEGFGPILIRGSDSPAMDGPVVARALQALEKVDLALCPDLDGGYNLVAFREAVRGVFDHPMSTGRVLEDTVGKARELGLRVALLPKGFDIDTANDLQHLAARRKGLRTCSRTFAFLDTEGLWPNEEKRRET